MEKVIITIAIADDHNLFRKSIADLLSQNEFKVIIECASVSELIEALTLSTPDMCILDINMPGINGYEAIELLKQRWPSIKILVLSMFSNEYTIGKCLEIGANGFIPKGTDPNQLYEALHIVYNGEIYLPKFAANGVVKYLRLHNQLISLNEIELDFLKYCCSELTYQEIADKMNIAKSTAESYRNSLFKKLQLNTRTGLALFAVNIGIIPFASEIPNWNKLFSR